MKKANKRNIEQNQPIRLTKQQQEDPMLVFDSFFDNYHLKDVREVLWNWLTAGLSSDNGVYQNGRSRSDLIFLYENVESLAEAAFLLLQKRKGVLKTQ